MKPPAKSGRLAEAMRQDAVIVRECALTATEIARVVREAIYLLVANELGATAA